MHVMKRAILAGARRLFAMRGYEVQVRSSVDKRATGTIPERRLPRPVVIHVPIRRARGLYWFPLEGTSHPFVATLAAYGEGRCPEYEESPLESFYDCFQPERAIDVLGLSPGQAPGFAHVPPYAFTLPWKHGEPSQNMENLLELRRKEAEEHRVHFGTAGGTTLFGPVSPEMGRFQFSRLTRVYDSIRKNGYRRLAGKDGELEGTLLLDHDMSWCIRVWRGNHRVAALAALGYETLPIRLRYPPIYAAEAELWPQVKSGLTFTARPPSANKLNTRSWLPDGSASALLS